MIVKLRTVDDGWVYFNALKGVKVRKLTNEQWNNVWKNKDTKYMEVNIDNIENIKVSVIVIHGNITVYTNTVAYLLNDNGKTIEMLT